MLPRYIEAQYADGFTLVEDDEDKSSHVEGRNVFWDILHRLPEAEHGKMERFSLVDLVNSERIDVDFKILPDNARPIRYKHMQMRLTAYGAQEPELMGIDFGYQYTDEDGNNQQEVIEVR